MVHSLLNVLRYIFDNIDNTPYIIQSTPDFVVFTYNNTTYQIWCRTKDQYTFSVNENQNYIELVTVMNYESYEKKYNPHLSKHQQELLVESIINIKNIVEQFKQLQINNIINKLAEPISKDIKDNQENKNPIITQTEPRL